MWRQLTIGLALVLGIAGCGGGSGSADDDTLDIATPPVTPTPNPPPVGTALDEELRELIALRELTGDPAAGRDLPSIDDPLAQLGKKLFFTKALGGEFDSACVSCHHPVLGGSDALSLSVGVGSLDPDVLGLGRRTFDSLPNVPRNAPTTFNIGLWDAGLFMDSRVASLGGEFGQNGAASGISTPDSGLNVIDLNAGANLVEAQARFPVTSVEEMRGALVAGESGDAVRQHLAARLGNYSFATGEIGVASWLREFRMAFMSAESAENLITYDNIAAAIAAYERSQVFVDTPWRAYVEGDNGAISDEAKEGAVLFYTEADDDGAACFRCHSGDLFTDEAHHTVAAPQFGPGKAADGSDLGRALITGAAQDRFRFRTPSLLNIEVTGPYMHSGAYETLQQVVQHYDNTNNVVDDFFDDGGWCQLDQFQDVNDCENLYPQSRQHTEDALDKIAAERRADDPDALPNINLNNNERAQLVAFLETLTDPCVLSRTCLQPWIAEPGEAPDSHQLNALDGNGNAF